MKEKEIKKLTLEEYQQKYNRKVTVKQAKSFLTIVLALVAILLIYFLAKIVIKIFELHQIAGYVSLALAILIFIFLFVVPVVKIFSYDSFITTVNRSNIKNAKISNQRLRKNLANKIIEFSNVTDNIGWYNQTRVDALTIAMNSKDNEAIKAALSDIYKNDISKGSNRLILDKSIKVGILTAVSQSQNLDTIIISLYELDLIKNIIYMYGYRPSESQLAKIYMAVLRNALIAYGVQSLSANATGLLGKAAESIPLLGSAISTIIGSASQGLINGLLTVIVGFQTKKYLKEQFKLQELLDTIEEDEKSEAEIMDEVKTSIINETKKLKKQAKSNS